MVGACFPSLAFKAASLDVKQLRTFVVHRSSRGSFGVEFRNPSQRDLKFLEGTMWTYRKRNTWVHLAVVPRVDLRPLWRANGAESQKPRARSGNRTPHEIRALTGRRHCFACVRRGLGLGGAKHRPHLERGDPYRHCMKAIRTEGALIEERAEANFRPRPSRTRDPRHHSGTARLSAGFLFAASPQRDNKKPRKGQAASEVLKWSSIFTRLS